MTTTHKFFSLALGLITVAVSSLSAHSDAFKPEFVDTLIAPYLHIQKGLANDDLAEAKAGAKAYLAAMKTAPDGEAEDESKDLRQPAIQVSKASDIKAARSAFLTLSDELTSLVKHVGTSASTPLFVAHCPMAFGGKGGDWLQSDKTVSNPYYGSMMLRCGGVKEQIAGEKEAMHHNHADDNTGHGGHGGHGSVDHDKNADTSYSVAKLDAVHAGVAGYRTSEQVASAPTANSAATSGGCAMACCASEN